MRVYRIEDRVTGTGAYSVAYGRMEDHEIGGGDFDSKEEGYPSYFRDMTAENHPAPRHDGLHLFPDGWLFGFGSVDAMRDWFFREPLDEERMKHWGLHVVVYEVDPGSVKAGSRQLVFDPDEAIQMKTYETTDFKGD